MNKYNHWLGKLFATLFNKGNLYAVTIGQTTYYSCSAADVGDRWRRHEDKHKEQWKRDKWKFLASYLYQWATKGYKEISYEKEAIAASETPLRFGN